MVARYLLGRAYRRAGQPDKGEQVLKPVIDNHPDEFRSYVEYVLSMYQKGEAYPKCIAVLKLSTLYGLSDPRFIGTLGGMLFMNGEFSAAKEVFAESFKREFPAEEANSIHFRPLDLSDRTKYLRLVGTVTAIKTGYAFIEAPGYDSFFCPGNLFSGLLLQRGLSISFEPAFTARGAVANKLEAV
jgi:hypothetical protein